MGQTLLGIAIAVVFLFIGAMLIQNPKSYLAKLGRRAMRIIGAGFLILVFMTLVQGFRNMR